MTYNCELFNRYFETRARYMHRLRKLRREYLSKYYWMKDHIATFLPRNKNVKILVLGSGLGHEVWALNRMGYHNTIGIDIDPEQVNIARLMGVNCIRADALEYLKEQRNYNVILAFNLIEHFDLDNALKLCKLCYSALSKEGILIILTPNASNPLVIHSIYDDLTHKIGAFTETSITQLLRLAGFKKIRVYNVKPFGSSDSRFSKRVLKFFGKIVVQVTWQFIKLIYLLNGLKEPTIVSSDILAIGYK